MTIDWMNPSNEMLEGRDAGRADRQNEIDDLQLELEAVQEELDDLKAQLPTTADGVPVVPGMTVWFESDDGRIVSARALKFVADTLQDIHTPYGWRRLSDCYSTQAAAQAAADAAGGE